MRENCLNTNLLQFVEKAQFWHYLKLRVFENVLTSPFFRPGIFVRRLVVAFLLVNRFFVPRFFVSARLFAPGFRAAVARWFIARDLDAAQGAAQVFNLALVAELLLFRQFDEFQDMFHLLKGLFERRDDLPHLVHGLRDGGGGLFAMDFLGWWSVNGWPVNGWPFNRRRFHR